MWAQDVCSRQDFTVAGFARAPYVSGVTLSRCQVWMGTFFWTEFQNLIKITYQTHRCVAGSLSSLPCLIILRLYSRVGISLDSSGRFSYFSLQFAGRSLNRCFSRQPCVTRWRKREICDFGEAGRKLATGKRSSTHRDRLTLKNRFPNSCLDCWYLRSQARVCSLSALQ